MLNKKRGQMEIMGLAIIFVLVIMGVLFALRFVLLKPEPTLRQEFLESRLAYNMVTALRGTTTDCRSATVERLLQDCATTVVLNCQGVTSCDKADLVIRFFLTNTLDKWGRNFEFRMEGPDRVEAIQLNNTVCRGEVETESQPIATRAGNINMVLKLC